jgi:hypothetical protein
LAVAKLFFPVDGILTLSLPAWLMQINLYDLAHPLPFFLYIGREKAHATRQGESPQRNNCG